MMPILMMLHARGKLYPNEVFIGAGIFKGGSTSCISPICKELEIPYIAADTFEGLPWGSKDDVYSKGQFLGTISEVKDNLFNTKALDGVEFAKGLFSETLPKIKQPIAGIFIDGDLYDSVKSALNSVIAGLSSSTLIFIDGISLFEDFNMGVFSPYLPESQAVNDFFIDHNIKYECRHTYQGSMCVFASDFNLKSGDKRMVLYNKDFYLSFVSLLNISLLNDGINYPWGKAIRKHRIPIDTTLNSAVQHEFLRRIIGKRIGKAEFYSP